MVKIRKGELKQQAVEENAPVKKRVGGKRKCDKGKKAALPDDTYTNVCKRLLPKQVKSRSKRVSTRINKKKNSLRLENVSDNESSSRVNSEESDIEDDIPLVHRLAYKQWAVDNPLHFPTICTSRFEKFLQDLKGYQESAYQKEVKSCQVPIHSPANIFWKATSVHFRAINDCILHRKWENLTHLLLVLSENYNAFKGVWPYLQPIICKLNPAIAEYNMLDQFKYVGKSRR